MPTGVFSLRVCWFMSAVKDGAKLRPLEAVTVANHTSNTVLHMVSPTRPIFGHTAKADHEIVGIWDPLVHPDEGRTPKINQNLLL